MSVAQQQAIILMLHDADPAIQKRGLQRLCVLLQKGTRLSMTGSVEASLRPLRWSRDIKVRSWLYNTLARLRSRAFRDYLSYQILLNEEDAENRAWAVAAFFSTATHDEIKALLRRLNDDFYKSPLELAAQLYYDGALRATLVQRPFERSIAYDSMFARWYCVLFGYGRAGRLLDPFSFTHTEYVASLNTHHDDDVAEYSLWSLHMSNAADYRSATIRPDEVMRRGAHVRRWFYRLLTKSPAAVVANSEFLKASMANESDVIAREGLAIGLSSHYLDEFADIMLDWFLSEEDQLVCLALAPHFAAFAGRHPDYEDLVSLRLSGEAQYGLVDSLIAATTLQERPTKRLTELADARLRPKKERPIVFKMKGAIHVSNENKTVTNIAYGGNVTVGTINFGAIEASTLKAIANMPSSDSPEARLRPALEGYAKVVGVDDAIALSDRAVLLQAVRELATLHERQEQERPTAVKKAVATLKGIATSLPAAGVVLRETHALLAEIAKYF